MRTPAFTMRALRLAVASLPVVAAFTVAGVTSRIGPVVGGCAQASSAHHAALVVEHGDGATTKVCVSFSDAQITGEQLLNLSGVSYNTVDYGSYGKAVCQIEGEPATYPPGCWTASSPYWAMFVSRGGGSWQSSSLGISSQTFRDGDAEGFRYESQSDSSAPTSPAGVCPPPATATAPPVAVTAPPNRPSGSNPAARATAPTTPAPAATTTARATPSPSAVSSSPAASTGGAVAGVATGPAAPPPPRPGSAGAGVWAASALAIALVSGVVLQVVRLRRRPPSRLPE
ncbi:MAG TPA: hypothetical protein VH498_08595 [Candidatus Dormibacteraeota bacterium]|nr:hypothetical protein [Candidatus Dormibacteraeota bacterium]